MTFGFNHKKKCRKYLKRLWSKSNEDQINGNLY